MQTFLQNMNEDALGTFRNVLEANRPRIKEICKDFNNIWDDFEEGILFHIPMFVLWNEQLERLCLKTKYDIYGESDADDDADEGDEDS